MASNSSEKFAGYLLPHAKDKKLVNILLPKADISLPANFSAPASVEVAGKYFKGDLNKVVSIVSFEGTDPELLKKFAKDSRVSVRRALIKNPSTPYATKVDLAKWAFERADETAGAALSVLKADDIVTILENSNNERLRGYTNYEEAKLAQIIFDSQNAQIILRAFKISNVYLSASLASKIYKATNPPLSLTEAISAHDELTRKRVIESVVSGTSYCSKELATILASSDENYYLRNEGFILFEDEAAEILAKTTNSRVLSLLTRSNISGEIFDDVIESSFPSALTVLQGVGENLTKKQCENILRKITQEAKTFNDNHIHWLNLLLQVSKYAFKSNDLLDAFRSVGNEACIKWIAGNYPNNLPRKNEITQLLNDPGNAFKYSNSRLASYQESDVSKIIVVALDSVIGKPWAEEYVKNIGPHLFPTLAKSPKSAAWVTSELHKAFGVNESCWETALTLMPTWADDFESLIETISLINDVEIQKEETVSEKDYQPEPLI